MDQLSNVSVSRTRRRTTEAGAALDAILAEQALSPAMDKKKKSSFQQQASRIAKYMVELAFTYPSLEKTTIILSHFLKSPAIRASLDDPDPAAARATVLMMQNLNDYLNKINTTRGARTTENEKAVREVVAAVSGPNLKAERLQSAAAGALGIHPRRIAKGTEDRKKMNEAEGTGWIQCSKKKYRNSIPDEVHRILDEWLHGDQASRPDNYHKQNVILHSYNAQTEMREYVTHWRRELRGNWKTLFLMLSGRDVNGDPVPGFEPTEEWNRILLLTKDVHKHGNGIKGTPALLSN